MFLGKEGGVLEKLPTRGHFSSNQFCIEKHPMDVSRGGSFVLDVSFDTKTLVLSTQDFPGIP